MTSIYELTHEELEFVRNDFEVRYAKHVKSWCGMADSANEIRSRIHADRSGRHYKDASTDNAWVGFQAGYIHPSVSTPDFLSRLDRSQLARCVELANSKLDALRSVDKIEVWHVSVDETIRYTAKTPDDALDWLSKFAAAFADSPKPDLLDCRNALSIDSRKMYADEIDDWIANNDKPDFFVKR